MEIFELRYFLAVAESENIHRASEKLRVSPGSFSKAISRIEEELGVKLFSREGRNIRLTSQGAFLQRRASEIVSLEEAARIEIAGQKGTLHVSVAGPEVLLTHLGLGWTQGFKKKHKTVEFEFHAVSDEDALEKIERGEAHLGFITSDVPTQKGFVSKVIAETHFQTCVGEKHPLYSAARAGKVLPVKEVLKHPFVSPSNPLLGKVGLRQSLDGWRDDQFPRNVAYLTSSLKLLEQIVASGEAVAYLPDYFCDTLPVKILKISGCPYSCVQKVKMVARNPQNIGWLSQLF